mmetsp:Transcript_44105/g.138192  ORF Transcript_44105/g.138192 Transcript_44105/m.138192 type:complete len:238 (+) Transcript_44105:264-977(+)
MPSRHTSSSTCRACPQQLPVSCAFRADPYSIRSGSRQLVAARRRSPSAAAHCFAPEQAPSEVLHTTALSSRPSTCMWLSVRTAPCHSSATSQALSRAPQATTVLRRPAAHRADSSSAPHCQRPNEAQALMEVPKVTAEGRMPLQHAVANHRRARSHRPVAWSSRAWFEKSMSCWTPCIRISRSSRAAPRHCAAASHAPAAAPQVMALGWRRLEGRTPSTADANCQRWPLTQASAARP